MFDIAWSELLLVAVIAILVVGPKELPGMLRSLGRGLGKLRRTADEFRKHFDEAIRDAGGEDLQREMRSIKQNNPLNQIRDSIEDATRDPAVKTPKAGAKPSAADNPDDDLGPPPPPLPPKNPQSSQAMGTGRSEAASGPVQAETESQDGAGAAQRVNGEHRAAG